MEKKIIIRRKEEANVAMIPYLTNTPKEYNLIIEEIIIYSFLWDFLSGKETLLALTDKEIGEILSMPANIIKKGIQKLDKLLVINTFNEKNIRYISWNNQLKQNIWL